MKKTWTIIVLSIALLLVSGESVGKEKYTLDDVVRYIISITEWNTKPTIKQTPLGIYRVDVGIIFAVIDKTNTKKQEEIMDQLEIFQKQGLLVFREVHFVDKSFTQTDRIEEKIDYILEKIK